MTDLLVTRFRKLLDEHEYGALGGADLAQALAAEARSGIYAEDQLDRAARALNDAGWTCAGGSHEPGQYDDCDDCRKCCIDVAREVLAVVSPGGALAAQYPTECETVDEEQIEPQRLTLEGFARAQGVELLPWQKAAAAAIERGELPIVSGGKRAGKAFFFRLAAEFEESKRDGS